MNAIGNFFEGALIGLGLLYVIRAVCETVLASRKRRRERIIAEAEEQARADIQAAMNNVKDQLRAIAAAEQAEFEAQRQTCTCADCKAWRTWAAGRNN
jgi:hypothetical protein